MGQSEDLKATMESIAAGRTSNLLCPFCKGDNLKKEMGDYGPVFNCRRCKKFVEAPMDDI
jgi:ribosomal protein L37AE/L43A